MNVVTRTRIPVVAARTFRYLSNDASAERSKRFMQTIPVKAAAGGSSFYSGLNYSRSDQNTASGSSTSDRWSKHDINEYGTDPSSAAAPLPKIPIRRSRTSRFSNNSLKDLDTKKPGTVSALPIPSHTITEIEQPKYIPTPTVTPVRATTTAFINSSTPTTSSSTSTKKKRVLRPRKALITLTSNAVDHLQALLNQPQPKLIRIGVRNRGCSGLTYNLEYVDQPGKFDELIEQDGVKVLIDSKALFSIVGSEMDWLDDKLSSRFIFKNPNSKGTCGCGESFMV